MIENQSAPFPAVSPKQSQSMLGVVSFAISIGVGALIVITIIAAGILHSHSRGNGPYPGQMVIGLVLICLLALDVLALGLGVGGLCEKGKAKVFAVLGVVLSSATLLGTIALIAVGLLYASRMAR